MAMGKQEPRVPVYLINGFLESGKTSFIEFTLSQEYFDNGERTLIILCEEGEVELDEAKWKKHKVDIVTIDSETELTATRIQELNKTYAPDRVLIEYNGMWRMETIYRLALPADWIIYQVVTTVNAMTFDVYLNNMKSMIVEQVVDSDLVIFNRCQAETPLATYRRSIRVNNPRAQVVFENEDGEMEDAMEELPYDLEADVIEIDDIDFGIFYIDAQDHPENYNGKTVSFKGMVLVSRELGRDAFVPGRHAMTCCADDLAFIGFVSKSKFAKKLKRGDWVKVKATVKYEYSKQYQGEGPVLYAEWIEPTEKPKEEVVYF